MQLTYLLYDEKSCLYFAHFSRELVDAAIRLVAVPSLSTFGLQDIVKICPFPRELVDAAIRLVAVPSLSSAFVALDFCLAGKTGRSSISILDGKFRKLYTLLTCVFYIQALQACALCLLLYTALRTVLLTLKPFRLLFCYSYFSM